LGEWLHRELQRAPSRRAARRRNLLLTPRGPNRHRELAAPLQHDQAARLTWIQATGTGGIRARLRRVACCAIPSASTGHAGETANLKLTFHLDHTEGADQIGAERTIPGTLRALAVSYFASLAFRTTRPSTQYTYRNIIDRLCTEHGDKRVALLQRVHVI